MFLIPKSFILSIAGVSALGAVGSYGVPKLLSSDESLRVGGISSAVKKNGKVEYDCFAQQTQQNSLMKCVFDAIKNNKKTP